MMTKSDYPGIKPYNTPVEKFFPKGTTRSDLDGLDKKILPSAMEATGMSYIEDKNAEHVIPDIRLPHPLWTQAECDAIEITHKVPHGFIECLAYSVVWLLRRAYDLFTGYTLGYKSGSCMLRRITILETVAGIPGMVGAAIRHMKSLRSGSRDYGWIHSLLEEAENERMHLLIAMSLHDPSKLVRMVIRLAQAIILPTYTIAYMVSPKLCHNFVGYIEEEAVKTYTQILNLIDEGKLDCFLCEAPPAARKYYHLPEGVNMRDIINNIRADEANHRQLNHCLAALSKTDINPFPPGF